MKNLLSLDSFYDKLNSSHVYIMDNSTYNIYDKVLINITGIIDGPQPRFGNKSIVVMINLDSEDKLKTEINCLVNNVSENNYTTLDCKAKETIKGTLQSAMSFIDNEDILLINSLEANKLIIEMNNNETIGQKSIGSSIRLIRKSNGLSGGVIAVIAIIPIIVIAVIPYMMK